MSQIHANPALNDPVAMKPQTTLEVSNCIALDHVAVPLPGFTKNMPEAERDSNQAVSPSAKTEPRPCQFEPLDLIELSKEEKTFKETSTEQALVLCVDQAQIRISSALLEGIEFSLLPKKTVVAVKIMAKEYWEAYRSSESSCFDEEKAILFAFLLIAIYELKELSLEELSDEREKIVYQLAEGQLRKYAVKLNEKIISQISKEPSISWKQLLQDMANVENSWLRRNVLIREDILETYAVLMENGRPAQISTEGKAEEHLPQSEERPVSSEAPQQCQDAQPQAEISEGASSTQQTESAEEEKARLIASLLKPNARDTQGSLETGLKNEPTIGLGNDDRVDFDDFSVETEGKVTEIDISLPLLQYNDDSQRVDAQAEVENLQNA